ncbi:Stage III sporulation protein AA [Candidatus Syntrophocurvum alkaliphilum]|uniref:Stage III sporulation protein AA n=1 Tax=Candidatus Syntrophocurvum alkaliphilum TaxID=2293317 RepID=A0A6I6DCU7_9FIRM|nr:stage III sporulation protein AA [Candidatus Syntrophocurvum alkaliphilum]QGT98950.1 Stage III sporulation protein AA [Candidatus Syntrophocurvum alkaliphilum]
MFCRDENNIKKDIIPYLSPKIKDLILNLRSQDYTLLEEIRLRCGKPLIIKLGDKDYTVNNKGIFTDELDEGYIADEVDLYRTIASISDNSLYAFEEEIKRGFITIPGGHRVGLAGQVVLNGGDIKTIKDFSGIAIRVAREINNCSVHILPLIYPQRSLPKNTLIISPPRCGKTTILRDIARAISKGYRNNKGLNVALIDERSELAGSFKGIPQLDVGPRTDVLDSCPKAMGMIMATRSLSPQVVVTDEIGRKKDVEAIEECINAGVTVITTVHAKNIEEVKKRPILKGLISSGAFKIGIILSRRNGPGSIEEVVRWD